MLDELKSTDFSPYLGQTFHVSFESQSLLSAELIEVTELSSGRGESDQRRSFSLVFRGPKTPVLRQRIYEIEHQEMGALGLFLVPIGPDEEGMRYEAVFT